ncbi:MAG TPA: hypothetical protein VIH35_00680, partial [Kiritimatiellia bacterium]
KGGPRRGGGGPGRAIGTIIALLLVGFIVLLVKPVKPLGAEGGLQEAQRLNQKIRLVRAAVLDGKAIGQNVSEAEANGYLAEVVKRTNESLPSGKKQLLMVRKVNLQFAGQKITVVVLAQMGPLTVSYSMTGQPARQGGQFILLPERTRVGLVPVPAAAGPWVTGRISYVFSKLNNERALLDQVSKMEVRDGAVVVAFQGAP